MVLFSDDDPRLVLFLDYGMLFWFRVLPGSLGFKCNRSFYHYYVCCLTWTSVYKMVASLCLSVFTPLILSNSWTDHDKMWHAYVNRSGNGSNLKTICPMFGPKEWAHWSRYLASLYAVLEAERLLRRAVTIASEMSAISSSQSLMIRGGCIILGNPSEAR